MTHLTSREVRLASRPTGVPTAHTFSLAQVTIESPGNEQVPVRNLFMFVDPYMRGRMNDAKSYVAPFQVGKPLEGGAVGEVVESRASGIDQAVGAFIGLFEGKNVGEMVVKLA